MRTVNDFNDTTKYWFDKSMLWMDDLWNPDVSLCLSPIDRDYQWSSTKRHTVRNSVWYATGLLMRQNNDDVERAIRAIETIMAYQFDDPSAVYHGTFYRAPEEPHPPANPTIWQHYDPNWREFICTVFIILLKEFDDLLPDDLQDKMLHSIQLAAEGAYMRKVDAEYTNISLMSAFLLDFAGRQFDHSEWQEYAFSQANEIKRLFDRYKTYNEYNSPTYYGIDFYALALWRKYGATDDYQSMGTAMEAALWRDMAEFYHADMKNICGPFDRSYGMDMTDYIAAVALWIAAALPVEQAPLPDVDKPFHHPGDYFFMPMVALVETMPPDSVIPYFKEFPEDEARNLTRIIEPQREVTAWLSAKLMLGAEKDDLNPARSDQFHPATAHWIAPDGSVNWMRTRCAALIQATANPYELQLSGEEDSIYVFELRLHDTRSLTIQPNRWILSGITIELERPNTPFSVQLEGDRLTIQFVSDQTIRLRFHVDSN